MNLTTNGVVSSNISNEGTLRLRAGYLLTDRLLGYVTGGIAYGQWGASEVGGITGCAAGTCFNDYCCATINTRGWPGSCCERQSQAGGEHCHSTGT
jgi:opacity protein-like surface antigen